MIGDSKPPNSPMATSVILPGEIRINPFERRTLLVSRSPRLEIVWMAGNPGQMTSIQLRGHTYTAINRHSGTIRRINAGAPAEVEWLPMSIGFMPAGWRLDGELTSTYEASALIMDEDFFRGAANDNMEYRPDRFHPIVAAISPTGAMLIASLRNLATGPDEWPLLAEHVASSLASHLLRYFSGIEQRKTDPYPFALPRNRLQRVIDFVEANIHRVIHLSELAGVAALSQFHFTRSFRQSMGMTPVRYVWRQRVERAKVMLRNIETPLAAIALDCGFSSQSHFTTVFKRETGFTPAQYRAQL